MHVSAKGYVGAGLGIRTPWALSGSPNDNVRNMFL